MKPSANIPYPFWIIISCCALMTTGISIPLNCAGLFYASVCQSLGVGTGPLSLYMTIQCVVMALCLPLANKILTTRDVRFTLSGAVILYALAFGSMGFYTSLTGFYVSGVLLGIAGSFIVYLCVPVLVNSWFKTRVGTAMGVAYAFIGVGAAIFSPITGFAITHFGWQTSYVFLGVMMAAISLPFTLFVVRGKPEELGLRPYGADDVVETLADDSGLTKREALRTSQFYMVLGFACLLGVNAAFMYHIPTYIISLDFTAAEASTVMATGMIGITLGKLGVGYLIDKIGILCAGPLGIFVGLCGAVVLFVWGGLGLGMLMLGTSLFGVAYACTVLEPPHVVKLVFGNKEYSAIYSFIMIFSSCGTAFGASILGFMRDATGSYTSSIVLTLLMMITAAVLLVMAIVSGKKALAANAA